MASKWMKGKEKAFKEFQDKKRQESDTNGFSSAINKWKTPERGGVDKPKIYQTRLLFDKNGDFYKSFHYHMYQDSSGKWVFLLCPKTYGFDKYCPFCAAVMRLYKGSQSDKRTAYKYKRKNKHCVNAYIIKDPRDAEAQDDRDKVEGKVLIYEFPDKVESKIKAEMNDSEYGAGINIFDPGDDGVDFILKVGSTKPTQEDGPNKGKQFHDYGDSKFSNKPKAIAGDKDIEKIIKNTHDLNAHLTSMAKSDDEILELVKSEMLFDYIADDYPDQGGSKTIVEEIDNTEPSKPEPKTEKKEAKVDETPDNDDISDEDLLAELDNL